LGGALATCALAPEFCIAAIRVAAPYILEGIHSILKAADVFNQYSSNFRKNSLMTVLIRTGVVVADLLQVALIADNVGDIIAAGGAAAGLGDFLVNVFKGGSGESLSISTYQVAKILGTNNTDYSNFLDTWQAVWKSGIQNGD